MDIFVARQPIFNRKKEIVAYELLYRNSLNNYYDEDKKPEEATSELITNSFLNIGIDEIVDNKLAFINFNETLINTEVPKLLDKERFVIEILETVKPDRKLLSNLLELKQMGYILALDDFVIDYPYIKTLPIYDIIKVDFIENGLEVSRKIIEKYSNGKRKFLAEKVETQGEFDLAYEMGYDYFQGFFFSKPQIVRGKGTESINFNIIKLREEISKPELDFDAIRKIIEQDVGLSYKLLKLVNSYSLRSEVKSIRHALAILGAREIEKWLNFILISDISTGETNDIVKLSIIRSRFCELICENSNKRAYKYQASLAGLFSLIDVLLRRNIDKIFSEIPMSKEVKGAIKQDPNSKLFEVLSIVLCYEKADWVRLDEYAKKIDIDISVIPGLYLESVKWANDYVFRTKEM